MSTATQLTVAANNGHAPARVSLLASMAAKYSMEPETFKNVIKQTVMPANASNEQMAAFLLVAHEYDLNPITKEIYAFPAKGGGVTPVVGVDGWINLAQRRPEFDGMEHEWAHDDKGNPISCTCRVWRKDRTRPVVVTEFMDECKRGTDPWRSHPRRMLRHKATIQAIRYAFGFAGIKDEDDAEVIYSGPVEAPRAAPVADLNARLAAVSTPALPEPVPVEAEPEPSAEWPQAHPVTGEMIDARGMPWHELCHSRSRVCNADGTWRRRRGANQESIDQLEREILAERAALATAPEPDANIPDPEEPTAAPSDFEKIRAGLAGAATLMELRDWADWSREVVISHSQRQELDAVTETRRQELSATPVFAMEAQAA